ncbi:hypothetical protein CWI36_0030p0010 [Hamiltosporidium magnivora]|uniref:Uncharacterized protein n=1 Tax=Hamiltosporidium magnivora TaxID=148818 RepID=A0A4Q9LM34_9MICR|nr:hypothetical protein CWI36_0030p0010 [Hamiltosporidium magnivora]
MLGKELAWTMNVGLTIHSLKPPCYETRKVNKPIGKRPLGSINGKDMARLMNK